MGSLTIETNEGMIGRSEIAHSIQQGEFDTEAKHPAAENEDRNLQMSGIFPDKHDTHDAHASELVTRVDGEHPVRLAQSFLEIGLGDAASAKIELVCSIDQLDGALEIGTADMLDSDGEHKFSEAAVSSSRATVVSVRWLRNISRAERS